VIGVDFGAVAEQVVGWGVLLGCVGGFFLGRRRGRERLSAAISAARAEGHAAAVAELRATQTVQVAVDASRQGHYGVSEGVSYSPEQLRAIREGWNLAAGRELHGVPTEALRRSDTAEFARWRFGGDRHVYVDADDPGPGAA